MTLSARPLRPRGRGRPRRAVAITGLLLAALVGACASATVPAARILHPTDGAVVGSRVEVMLTADHVALAPCGDPDPCRGHLTVLVDRPCVAPGEVVPSGALRAADTGVHALSEGGTVALLDLEPGPHTLCAQLADGLRVAFGATHTITITVDPVDGPPWRSVMLPSERTP